MYIVLALITTLLSCTTTHTSMVELIALEQNLEKFGNQKFPTSLTEEQRTSLQQMAAEITAKLREFDRTYSAIQYGDKFKDIDRSQWAGMLAWLESARALKEKYETLKDKLPANLYNAHRYKSYSAADLGLVDKLEYNLLLTLNNTTSSLKDAINTDLKRQEKDYLRGVNFFPPDLPKTRRSVAILKKDKEAMASYISNLLNTDSVDPAEIEKMIQAADPVYRASLLSLFNSVYKDHSVLNELEKRKAALTAKLLKDLNATHATLAKYEKNLPTAKDVQKDVVIPAVLAMRELCKQHTYLPEPMAYLEKQPIALQALNDFKDPFYENTIYGKLRYLYQLLEKLSRRDFTPKPITGESSEKEGPSEQPDEPEAQKFELGTAKLTGQQTSVVEQVIRDISRELVKLQAETSIPLDLKGRQRIIESYYNRLAKTDERLWGGDLSVMQLNDDRFIAQYESLDAKKLQTLRMTFKEFLAAIEAVATTPDLQAVLSNLKANANKPIPQKIKKLAREIEKNFGRLKTLLDPYTASNKNLVLPEKSKVIKGPELRKLIEELSSNITNDETRKLAKSLRPIVVNISSLPRAPENASERERIASRDKSLQEGLLVELIPGDFPRLPASEQNILLPLGATQKTLQTNLAFLKKQAQYPEQLILSPESEKVLRDLLTENTELQSSLTRGITPSKSKEDFITDMDKIALDSKIPRFSENTAASIDRAYAANDAKLLADLYDNYRSVVQAYEKLAKRSSGASETGDHKKRFTPENIARWRRYKVSGSGVDLLHSQNTANEYKDLLSRFKRALQLFEITEAVLNDATKKDENISYVKKKHIKLLAQYHPDKPGGSLELSQEVTNARDILRQYLGTD